MSVVDASVLLGAFLEGASNHGAAQAWLRTQVASGGATHIPTLALVEVSGSLGRRLGRTEPARAAIAQLQALRGLKVHPVTKDLAEYSAHIAASVRMKGGDAIYVALAQHLGEELVTLDAEQLERGAAIVRTRRPA